MVGSPDGVVLGEGAAGVLVSNFNEVADESVGVVLVGRAVGEPIVLEVVKEFAGDFLDEFRAELETCAELSVALLEQDIAEPPKAFFGFVEGVFIGLKAERLTKGIADSQTAEAVKMVLVEPEFDEIVDSGLFVAEKGFVDVEVGLIDFDGAIAIKGHVHAKTSL